jgi:hypothetical protein
MTVCSDRLTPLDQLDKQQRNCHAKDARMTQAFLVLSN